MGSKFLAFDIEIARVVPDDETDWKAHRPLGISCAATWASDEDEPNLWYSRGEDGQALSQMTVEDVQRLVDWLWASALDGQRILTHNGLGFDFDILAEEAGNMAGKCRSLALDHVDTMFHFFCIKGFPVGLDAVAKGMRLGGKTEGMDGAQAPILWQQGEYQKVLDYVAQDVRVTLDVAQSIEKRGWLAWVTKRGKVSSCSFRDGLLTVREALKLPEPDVSWMSEPMQREQFMAWMAEPEAQSR